MARVPPPCAMLSRLKRVNAFCCNGLQWIISGPPPTVRSGLIADALVPRHSGGETRACPTARLRDPSWPVRTQSSPVTPALSRAAASSGERKRSRRAEGVQWSQSRKRHAFSDLARNGFSKTAEIRADVVVSRPTRKLRPERANETATWPRHPLVEGDTPASNYQRRQGGSPAPTPHPGEGRGPERGGPSSPGDTRGPGPRPAPGWDETPYPAAPSSARCASFKSSTNRPNSASACPGSGSRRR